MPRSRFPSRECSLPYLNRCLAGRLEHTILAFVWPLPVLLPPHTVSSWRLLIAQHPRLGSSVTSPYLLSQCCTPPTKLLGILKMSFRQVVFSPLLMNNLAFAEALECLWDSRRVVAAVAAEFALAQGLGRGMVFAKDSFPKAIPTGPTLFYQLVQVNSPHGKKPPVCCPPAHFGGKLSLFCSSTSVLTHQREASITLFPCGRHLWPSESAGWQLARSFVFECPGFWPV